ncbi:PIG-L family deacetylase [Marinobacter nanhaiticus D15-8W]|uniref:PIG-L family deacetylase n=1 Tax=Marinobacter nanhaiticus D15-8W TaxID=626887 RepID=N6WWM5_9GAMM|nr:PIG-L family deacetylase [Marinobacter nanhaiticus]ENO13203.1 PIG-L family deacetylase [Marinobacter nanhaiticus D15-8W]BES70564.1 PIG-L family deacetylase [Marinobacter nanhaiticus D15-8W]
MNQIACVDSASCSNFSQTRPVLVDDALNAIAIEDLGPVLVASPHPDDESLGCGGLIARCADLSIPVTVLAMTSGDASHPGNRVWRRELATIRKREQRNALKTLGLERPDVLALELPDGHLDKITGQMRDRIVELIRDTLQSRAVRSVFVPAVDDCHNDHRETARLMAEVLGQCPVEYVFSYQIWPPEQRPTHVEANEQPYRHDIRDLLSLKRNAVHEHQSQLGGLKTAQREGFQMPAVLLEEKLKNQEIYALVRDLPAWSI